MKMDDLKRIIKLAGRERDYVDEADETPSTQGSAAGFAPAPAQAAPAATSDAPAAAPAAPAADARTYTTQKGVMGQPDTQQRSYASFGDFANKVMGKGDVNGKVAAPAATSAVPASTPTPQTNALGIAPQAQVAGASALTGGAPKPASTPAAPSTQGTAAGYAPSPEVAATNAASGTAQPGDTSAMPSPASGLGKGITAANNTPSTANMTNAADTLKAAQAGGTKTGTTAPAPAQAAVKPAATAGVPAKAPNQAALNKAGSNIGAGYAKAAAAPAAKPAAPNQPVAQANAAAAAAGNRGRGATTPPAPVATAAAKPAATSTMPAAKPAAPAAPKAPAAPAAPKAPAAPAAPKINPQSNNARAIERKKQEFMDQAKAAGIPAGAIPGSGVNPTSSGSYSVNTGGAKPANTASVPAQSFQQQGMQSYDFEESYQGRTGMKRSLVSIMEKFEAELNPEKKGMFKGKNKAELLKQYNALKKSGPHKKGSPENTKMHELAFAIRAKGGWGKVDEADMGKHNNATTGFKALAKKAAKEYGSKAAGERVAGAVKAKMAKAGQLEETATDSPSQTPTKTDIQKRELPKNTSASLGEEMFAKKKDKHEKHIGSFGRDTMTGKDKGLGHRDDNDGPLKNVAKGLKAFFTNKPEPMNENIKVEKMKSNYKNSGNFHKVKDMDKKFESSFTPHDADNPTQKPSKANKAYGNLKVELIKEDPQYSAWENQFQSYLAEEISISTTHNTGHQSDNGMNVPAPEDTVSINARGEDAKELMKLLQNAGMLGGGEAHEEPGHDIELDAPVDGHATISLGSDDDYEQEHGEEEHDHGDGYGTLQVIHPSDSGEVFGDDDKPSSHGDMMKDLLDKLTGIGAPDMSDDSDDEEDSDEDEEDSDEEDSDEEETSEGNMFTGNLAKARAAGKKTADLDGDGDEEPVKEESDAERDDKAEAAGKKVAKDIEYDDKKDEEEKERTDEGATCNECGMYESDCGCDHEQVDEGNYDLDPNMKSPNTDMWNKPSNEKFKSDYHQGGNAAYDMDLRGQQKYKDRTSPGIINKVKDTFGLDKPDSAYGPKEVKETDDGAVAHGYEQEEEYVSEGVGMIGTDSEGLENGADDQATQDLDFMTKVISGGLNKQKINQHVHPYNNPGPGLSESARDLMKPVSMKDILSRLTEIK